MSYPPRVFLDKGPLSHADVLKASPPPGWSAEDERAFARHWSRNHVSSPTSETRREAHLARARAEAQAMTGAREWQNYFKEQEQAK